MRLWGGSFSRIPKQFWLEVISVTTDWLEQQQEVNIGLNICDLARNAFLLVQQLLSITIWNAQTTISWWWSTSISSGQTMIYERQWSSPSEHITRWIRQQFPQTLCTAAFPCRNFIIGITVCYDCSFLPKQIFIHWHHFTVSKMKCFEITIQNINMCTCQFSSHFHNESG